MVHTGNRRAGSGRLVLFLLSMLLIAAACSPISDIEVSPTPEPRAQARPTVDRVPLAATQTAEAGRVSYTIERVTFATNVDPDGAPLEELSVIPADANNLFLSVLVSDLEAQTRFSAYWYEGDQIVDESEVVITQSDGSARWVSLGFQRLEDLNPSAAHSVELRINGQEVESYAFRVGTGELAGVVADSTLALGTNAEGQPVAPGDTFDEFAPQIVLVVRVSNNVDPTGMIFNAAMRRGDTQIALRTPDGGHPNLPEDPEPSNRIITFTFVSDARFVPGEYSVDLMINGTEVRTHTFTIVAGRMPTPTPEPSPTPTVTPTSVASGVTVLDAQIVTEIDEVSGEPESDPVDEWFAPAGEEVTFYVALLLSDLRLDDVVEVDVLQNREHFERHRFPMAAFEQGWLFVPVPLEAPSANVGEAWYEFLIFVNGTRAERETLSFVQREATPTPTVTETPTPTPEP